MEEEKKITVVKRDGTTEVWSEDKIMSSVMKAGLSLEKSQVLMGKMSIWVKGLGVDSIKSTEIRDKIITEMKEIEPITASVYEAYRK